MRRRTQFALLAIAAAALLLRLAPFFRHGGPLAWNVDYDEAVYFSASALLLRGVLPYRDFVFVHPPGIAYLLAVTSWMHDPLRGFAAARILAAIVGGISTYVVGRIALRAAGPVAAVAAAVLYATYPEAVNAERGPFIEMALNIASLFMAALWLRDDRRRNPFVAGLLCGCACAMKLFGGIWFLAALVVARRRDLPAFILGGILAGAVLLGPLFLSAPHAFVEDTLLFHLWRAPDGVASHAERLQSMLGGLHLMATVLAACALLLSLRDRATRFFAVAALLTVALFLASSSYWPQYNAHLAASECVLAGLGAAALLRRINDRIGVVLALLIAIPTTWLSIQQSKAASGSLRDFGRSVRAVVPDKATLFTMEPQWTLATGRIPRVVDTYGAMLLGAVRGGVKFRDTGAAFQSERAQAVIRPQLAKSQFVILGWRRDWQLNAATRAWLDSRFACVDPAAGDLCVLQQGRARAPIAFGAGWYVEEGPPGASWRWMGGRSSTTLPGGSGSLELQFDVPREALPTTVSVSIDGQVRERIAMTSPSVSRRYDVTGARGHAMELTIDKTVSPARLGVSGDTRELGLRLVLITWAESSPLHG